MKVTFWAFSEIFKTLSLKVRYILNIQITITFSLRAGSVAQIKLVIVSIIFVKAGHTSKINLLLQFIHRQKNTNKHI